MYLLCNWYRPGSSDESHLHSFRDEFNTHAISINGSIVAGDLNIHHRSWLTFANGNTSVGEWLWGTCREFNLKQIVKGPTREQYLLDLCLTDLEHTKCTIHPPIADHSILLMSMNIDISTVVCYLS